MLYPDGMGPVSGQAPKIAAHSGLLSSAYGRPKAALDDAGLLIRAKTAIDALSMVGLERIATRSRHNGQDTEDSGQAPESLDQAPAAKFGEATGPPGPNKLAGIGLGGTARAAELRRLNRLPLALALQRVARIPDPRGDLGRGLNTCLTPIAVRIADHARHDPGTRPPA